MPRITYVAADETSRLVDVPDGTSVMRAARDNGIEGIEGDCGGVCACATCHVYVSPQWFDRVGPPSDDEKVMLECANDVRDTSRLSCQILLIDELDGLTVHLPISQR